MQPNHRNTYQLDGRAAMSENISPNLEDVSSARDLVMEPGHAGRLLTCVLTVGEDGKRTILIPAHFHPNVLTAVTVILHLHQTVNITNVKLRCSHFRLARKLATLRPSVKLPPLLQGQVKHIQMLLLVAL